MNVPSYEFLVFATGVALAVNISDTPCWRQAVFLIANLAFITSFTRDPVQLVPFAAFLALGYASIQFLEHSKRKAAFTCLLAAIVLTFCTLKRYAFMPQTLFLPFTYMTVGMSYVFFRIVHLVIDAFQDSLPARMSALSYLTYTLNFTSLVSGPIQLYQDYLRTELKPPPLDERAAGRALERIIVGFFKVSIVSPLLLHAHAACVSRLSADLPFGLRVCDAGFIVAIFPLYVYANFSGYMDCVIGTARFLKLELPENFNAPFSAQGFIDFWGRWHMTLSTWFKTYVYSPLLASAMRRFPSRSTQAALGILAYFVTFFLVGIWHGQTTMFVVYGVLQGAGVSINKLYQIAMTQRLGHARYHALCARAPYASLSRGLTFTYFAFSLLWLWSSSWDQLGSLLSRVGIPGAMCAITLVVVLAAITLSALEYAGERATKGLGRLITSRYARTAWCTVLATLTLSVTTMLNVPTPHIIYKGY